MCAYLMKASQSVGVYSVMFMFACVMSQGLYQSEYNHNTVIRGSTTPSRQHGRGTGGCVKEGQVMLDGRVGEMISNTEVYISQAVSE